MMGPAMMFLFFALLVAAALLAVRLVGGAGGGGQANTSRADRSLEILRERYAKGELDSCEFVERRRVLRH